MQNSLDRDIRELRRVAEALASYTYPLVSIEDDNDVLPLRSRRLIVDGYDLAATVSLSVQDGEEIETLQIQGIYTPFLPFALVCKLGRLFLGSEHLSYMDVVKDNRKVYCWTCRRRKGRVVPLRDTPDATYEGFGYNVLGLETTN